jgi:hypothetical protein
VDPGAVARLYAKLLDLAYNCPVASSPTFQRFPESTQTLYAELFEQVIHAEAEAAALGVPHGSFVAKTVKGGTYWYLQRMEGERRRQLYLGRESPALLAWMEQVRETRARTAADEDARARLCGMLRAGGAAVESAAVTQVLGLLAGSGVFRLGGVLVGTQAFMAYGNMLGVRFDRQALRTQDVDVAQDLAVGIALSREERVADVEAVLTASGLGFFPVPGLDPRQPSTSFKIRGRELRVDFLTPLQGKETGAPVFLPSLGVSAHPLRFLDYLIEATVQAVVVGGSGILVNVPDPARFVLHKLWVAGRRPVSEQAKAAKDLRQAQSLLEVLLAERPADLTVAWKALQGKSAVAREVRATVERLPVKVREGLLGRIG